MNAITVQFPDDLAVRLETLSDRTGLPKTWHILEAVREHLDDLEDIHVDEQLPANLREAKSKILSAEEGALQTDKTLPGARNDGAALLAAMLSAPQGDFDLLDGQPVDFILKWNKSIFLS